MMSQDPVEKEKESMEIEFLELEDLEPAEDSADETFEEPYDQAEDFDPELLPDSEQEEDTF
jgi:hypothetical protein